MAAIKVKTAKRVIPMIYAYTTPEIKRHDGWTKIGYTEQDVDKRLNQQTHTADVEYKEEWRGTAIFDDGSGEVFRDTDFHAYLRKNKVEVQEEKDNEWFHITGPESRIKFYEFKENRGILKSLDVISPYKLRKEQQEAVDQTVAYRNSHEQGEFLWNAKPRFGKTLSVYDFCKRVQAVNVLIVTNRPAIANSWYSDYEKFLGTESGYLFVSNTDALKGKPLVLTREAYLKYIRTKETEDVKCIEFVSLQDLKGSIEFGGEHKKLEEVAHIDWDVLVIDEAHEGVDTYKTDVAFDHIKRKFTLHLSGTPFKALANDKFPEAAIYNWTYADEQRAKHGWDEASGQENPYENLPQLNMFTYQMSDIVRDELKQGIEINGETEEYAFDLNLFFETKNGKFTHESSVDKFLDALTTQEKFPFSTEELRRELKHTLWFLNRVDSAKALAKKLQEHPVFQEYFIIVAAGDGRIDEDDEDAENKKSYNKVTEAIQKYEKTITLSVGQLTTGITIPEWSAVLMLSNVKSPALYMQTAFRAQNPCLFKGEGQFYRKENAYVFDFDPARTLTIFEQFANDLCEETASGKGDSDKRRENIRELLNFFPVIGEDEDGKMIELDAEKVLSIPRKIRSQEVVRRGFMSDYLFQNIANVFHAPPEVINILENVTAVQEPKQGVGVNPETAEELGIDENGEVNVSDEVVIGISQDIFGDRIYNEIPGKLKEAVSSLQLEQSADQDDEKKAIDALKEKFHKETVTQLLETARESYGRDLGASEQKRLDKKLTTETEKKINRLYGDYQIQSNKLQDAFNTKLREAADGEEAYHVRKEFEEAQQKIADQFKQSLTDSVDEIVSSAGREIVKTVETSRREQEKKSIEGSIRDHLRGFSRTIPSFLMAYGTPETTLENFDQIIPDAVFQEVTSITLEQFRFLRDGGPYKNAETGEKEMFKGHLFEPVVFNDSVKEFLNKKTKLADYFEENSKEDIFDYIPPQKTNQIFTPKWVVKKMVDALEQENPGCFDQSDKTFIDLYMKSGLYITEIVKRLYRSEAMKALYPDKEERLRHIFEKQVYGLAPTEIIYRIAISYILGFDEEIHIEKHNFRQVDALQYAKEGTLEQKLGELFGNND